MSGLPHPCVVVGGGAAGVFAAIACADAGAAVVVLEKGAQPLTKVRISGGGRCNVTHACFDPQTLAAGYPRGGKELLGALTRFGPGDTVEWFEARGVPLKAEPDGRIFPISDSSRTIVDCLLDSLRMAGAPLRCGASVVGVTRCGDAEFTVTLASGETLACSRLLLATGGCRPGGGGAAAAALGHTIEPPVPSLFTLNVTQPWLGKLAGVSVTDAAISVPGTSLRDRGALLLTHTGLSGPAVLRLSAWGARLLHERDYRFDAVINWRPDLDRAALAAALAGHRRAHAARLVVNSPLARLPARLWENLAVEAGIVRSTRWGDLSRHAERRLLEQLEATRLSVGGRSVNKDEFVTCGGVRLAEVDFRTMESRICPGLHFAGELLDIDGVTGGYNFQAAWTTGWIAGNAMATAAAPSRHR